jgi:hypothetical protein
LTAYSMAQGHPPCAELQAPPFGRNLGARAVRSRNLPRLGAALDALKCHKSEIMDIFLEIPGDRRPQPGCGGRGACAGQGAPFQPNGSA